MEIADLLHVGTNSGKLEVKILIFGWVQLQMGMAL